MSFQQEISFFNTINLTGSELSVARGKCNRQEERILELMVPGVKYTPFNIQKLYETKWPKVPITSIRRAMTCLTDKGYLIKCEETRARCKKKYALRYAKQT